MNLYFLKNISYKSVISLLLVFFTGVSGTISSIWANTLFLSKYPPRWVIYFLIIQTLASIISGKMLTPFLVKNIKRNSIILIAISVIISSIVFILHFDWYWTAFICSVILGTLSALLIIIAWSLLPLAFSLRKYKIIVPHASRSIAFGNMIGSLGTSLLLKHFASLSILLVFLIVSLIFTAMSIHWLKILPQHAETVSDKKERSTPSAYAIYQYFLIFFIAVLITQALGEFLFKFELARTYKNEYIGIFMGYFIFITSLFALVISGVTTTKWFLQFFKIKHMLYITPFFMLISCALVMYSPSLWTFCILASIKPLFFYHHTWFGMEISLNILPFSVRTAAKAQLKSLISPAVTVLTFVVFSLISDKINLQQTLAVIAIFSIIALYYVHLVGKAYQSTLEDESAFQRFNILKNITEAHQDSLEKVALQTLKSDADSLVLFGLSLMEKIAIKDLPEAVYAKLDHPDPLIRLAVLTLIKQHPQKALPFLKSRLKKEKDQEIQLEIFNRIANIDFETAIQMARRDKNPAALGIFLNSAEPSERILAHDKLITLCQNKDVQERKRGAQIIDYYKIKGFDFLLEKLIQDPDDEVAKAAMMAAASTNNVGLVKVILENTKPGPRAITAKQALILLKAPVIPYLLEKIKQHPHALYIKILASIPDFSAEKPLLELAKTDNMHLRTQVAQQANFRAIEQSVSEDFKKQAEQFTKEEFKTIFSLYAMVLQYPKQFMQLEIMSRIDMAKKRLLYWVSIITDPHNFSQCISILLEKKQSLYYQSMKEKALELIEIYVKDAKIRDNIFKLFEYPDARKLGANNSSLCKDIWLTEIIHWEENAMDKEMTALSRVFDLRATNMFGELPAEVLLIIAKKAQYFSYKKDEVIFNKNDLPNGLYCISSGKVRIMNENTLLNILEKNEIFGELALLDDNVRTSSAIAETDCLLLLIEKTMFIRVMEDFPEVYRSILAIILGYFRENTDLV